MQPVANDGNQDTSALPLPPPYEKADTAAAAAPTPTADNARMVMPQTELGNIESGVQQKRRWSNQARCGYVLLVLIPIAVISIVLKVVVFTRSSSSY